MMEIKYGKGSTKYGPGVDIVLTGDELARAIDLYIYSQNVIVNGPRTVYVNGDLCERARVYVDPSGDVLDRRRRVDPWGRDIGYEEVVFYGEGEPKG